MQTVRTYETANNTYQIGLNIISKTTYEQQQQARKDRIYLIQKVLIILAIITVCTFLSFVSLELVIPMVLVGSFGIMAVVTNNL